MARPRPHRAALAIASALTFLFATNITVAVSAGPATTTADDPTLAADLPVAAAAAKLLLPDLKVVTMRDFHIGHAGGRRVLRFTGEMWNTGTGPLEVRASRATIRAKWDVDQIIDDTAGVAHRRQTAATMHYAGDGHDHFHVQQMMTYHLWGTSGTFRDAKIGFCFFDTDLIRPGLPHSPSHQTYHQTGCAHKGALHTRNGISVGWADKYPWNFAFQWIDITGLKGGTYTIRTAVDLFGYFRESNETNNCAWAKIKFGSTGSAVTVLDRGNGCINDYSTTPYADDVTWAIGAGVSSGCAPDMFCTNNPMNRGQAAVFLSKAFTLPAATADHFTDDDANAHEVHINRVAEAGLMTGCTTTHFCPDAMVTRGQTAVALAVALALPPATTDYFDDDTGSVDEAAINSVVEAGIWTGCGERTFCPTGKVTRGQMVAVLHRAIVPPTP
jgi:Lysyl oxidase/S-layer homology domain